MYILLSLGLLIQYTQVQATCSTQTITATTEDAYALQAVPGRAGGDQYLTSANQISEDFTNTDSVNCPITQIDVVDIDGNALAGDLANILSYADGLIKVDQTVYTGGNFNAQVYAVTGHGVRVYKSIAITQKQCTEQTLTAGTDKAQVIVATLDAAAANLLSTDTVVQLFASSDDLLCPVTYSIELISPSRYAAGTADLFTIVNDNENVQFDSTGYTGNTIHLRVKALTAANLPLYERVEVVETQNTCRIPSLTLGSADPLWYKALTFDATSSIAGDSIAAQYTNSDAANCVATVELVLGDQVTTFNTIQSSVVSNVGGSLVINSEWYDGLNFLSYIKINTGWDEPIYKEIRVSKLARFIKTDGLCKVTAGNANNGWPDDSVTWSNMASMEACRDDNCLSNSNCRGYQVITDIAVQDRNCAAFLETNPVAGDGEAGFDCYTLTADNTKPSIPLQIYVKQDGNCKVTSDSSAPTGKILEGVYAKEVCKELCNLNALCKAFEFQTSTTTCWSYADVNPLEGSLDSGDFECHLKQDAPTLTFSRDAGACGRADEVATENVIDQGIVTDLAACQTICQRFHVTCFGFDFQASDLTCKTYSETELLAGEGTAGKVCYIRQTAEQELLTNRPDPIFTKLTGQCAREDAAAITLLNDEGTTVDEAACEAICAAARDTCMGYQYFTGGRTCITYTTAETLVASPGVYQCEIPQRTVTNEDVTTSITTQPDPVQNGWTALAAGQCQLVEGSYERRTYINENTNEFDINTNFDVITSDMRADTDASWKKVRHVPATGNWHPASDHLAGSEVYGDSTDDSVAWSIKFDDLEFEEMVFSFGDLSNWILTTKAAVDGEYTNENREILKSSFSADKYVAAWYNRAGNSEDPWLSDLDHANCQSTGGPDKCMLYGGNDNASFIAGKNEHQGADVYIKILHNSASCQALCEDAINLPEQDKCLLWQHRSERPYKCQYWRSAENADQITFTPGTAIVDSINNVETYRTVDKACDPKTDLVGQASLLECVTAVKAAGNKKFFVYYDDSVETLCSTCDNDYTALSSSVQDANNNIYDITAMNDPILVMAGKTCASGSVSLNTQNSLSDCHQQFLVQITEQINIHIEFFAFDSTTGACTSCPNGFPESGNESDEANTNIYSLSGIETRTNADYTCHLPNMEVQDPVITYSTNNVQVVRELKLYPMSAGNCARVDAEALASPISTTVVADAAACQVLCAAEATCTVYQMRIDTLTCTIYAEAAAVQGDATANFQCYIAEPQFVSEAGQCKRVDDVAMDAVTAVVVADKAACAALCTADVAACGAYEFNTDTLACKMHVQSGSSTAELKLTDTVCDSEQSGHGWWQPGVQQTPSECMTYVQDPQQQSCVNMRFFYHLYNAGDGGDGGSLCDCCMNNNDALTNVVTGDFALGVNTYEIKPPLIIDLEGDNSDYGCNTMQIVPDATRQVTQEFAQSIGNCARDDGRTITQVIDEGAVADLDACKLLCTLNFRCNAYQFTTSDSTCKTFTDTEHISGDAVDGITCYYIEQPFEQTFSQYTGKCARTDNAATTLFEAKGTVTNVKACKEFCVHTCTTEGCTCKGYQFNTNDLTCTIYTETQNMIGDTTPGFQCFLEEAPFDNKDFNLEIGKCQRKDQQGTTLTKIEGVVFDRTACIALCQASKTCTAAQFSVTDKVCITFTETEPLVGEGTESYQCYVRLIAEREYTEFAGFCKMSGTTAETSTVSTNLVNSGALEKAKCQELCDSEPDTCLAYQIDLTEGAANLCVIFNEKEEMLGDETALVKCYLYKKTPEELAAEESAQKEVAVEKSTLIHHYMIAFTANMGHLQVVLDTLNDEQKNEALKCVSSTQKPDDGIGASSSYEDTSASLEKLVTNFFLCLKQQNPTAIPVNGYCGAPSIVAGQEPFVCEENACCGEGLATGAGAETGVFTCQLLTTTVYKPLKMKGYEQFDSVQDWPFSCGILGSQGLITAFAAFMAAAATYMA